MTQMDPEPAPVPAVPSRSRVRGLILGFVILLCGGAIGSVTTAVVLARQQPPPDHRRPERGPESIVQRMQHQYDLTDEQARELEGIFKEHWEKLSEIRGQVQPLVETEYEALQRSVESVLTPEQASQWRPEFEKKRRYWRSRGDKTSGPPPR